MTTRRESRMLMHMMQASGPGNRQVVPIAEDDEMYFDDDIPYEEEESPMERGYRDQRYFDWRQWYEQCTYENAKTGLKWLMQTASVDFSFTFEDLISLLTIYVLFADDIKLLSTDRFVDVDFSTSYAVCLFIFIFELFANTWTNSTFTSFYPRPKWQGYFLSFFWWLDLISIISLFPDVDFIAKGMGMESLNSSQSSDSRSFIAIRLVRLVRLARLYRIASERRQRREQDEGLMELVRAGVIKWNEVELQRKLYSQRQSKLGTQLSESTTRRVIVMILILLIIIPLLIYRVGNDGPQFAMTLLKTFSVHDEINMDTKQAVLSSLVDNLQHAYNPRYITYLTASPTFGNKPYIYFPAKLHSLRDSEQLDIDYVNRIDGVDYNTEAIFNVQYLVRQQAMFGIITTVFIAIMMIGGAVVINNDAERMVIAPIERMMNMVEAVAEDPLSPFEFLHDSKASAGDYETRLLESTVEKITGLLRVGFGEAGAGIISANLRNRDSGAAINPLLPGVRIYAIFGFCDIHHFEDINQRLANDVLTFVNTIAEIVHDSVHTWSGQCNKNLGNAFVIVWRIGDEMSLQRVPGAAGLGGGGGGGKNRLGSLNAENRNGSTKALLSAVDNALSALEEPNENKKKAYSVDLRRIPGVDILADHALISYLKIITEINRNKRVLKYRKEPRLTHNGREEFKVRMGFGLHAGWAIEGAVGSIQKVDATYLSPHVNMTARLETSSRQYGVPLLASQDFYDLLSNETQVLMRRLDVVTVKGSEMPIAIYTYDVLQEQDFKEDNAKRPGMKRRVSAQNLADDNTAPFPPPSPMMGGGTPSASGKSGRKAFDAPPILGSPQDSGQLKRPLSSSVIPGKSEKPLVFLTPEDATGDVFENDYDVTTLRTHVTPEFLETFKEGIQLYLDGSWKEAKGFFEKADNLMLQAAPSLGGDGPSKTLLHYMSDRNFEAPANWKGFRPLTAK